jgi:hypothetical protein
LIVARVGVPRAGCAQHPHSEHGRIADGINISSAGRTNAVGSPAVGRAGLALGTEEVRRTGARA